MKLLIAGCARDLEQKWERTSRQLETIFDSVDDYHCVIVESNSTDNTVKVLKDWEAKDSRRKILTLDKNEEGSRPKRIATARNAYMEYLQPFVLEYPYTLILDLDQSLEIDLNFKQQLGSCMERSDWDAVASNRRGRYYDVWALRSEELGITFDCWEQYSKQPSMITTHGTISTEHFFIRRFQKVIPENAKWIECQSAFGCMVLYKSLSIKDHRYDGSKTCEHVSFNTGLKMFINPAFISGGEALEHL